MSRRTNAKGRSTGGEKHVRLHRYLLRSPAYRSLNCYARCALVELYDLYNGDNNGDLFMSVRSMAQRLGIANGTAGRALDDLVDRGFIRPRQKGAFSLKVKHATSWILTEHSLADQRATKEFMRWQPTGQKQNSVSCGDTVGVMA